MVKQTDKRAPTKLARPLLTLNVILGLDPRIHHPTAVDPRVKPEDDQEEVRANVSVSAHFPLTAIQNRSKT
ncbi:MAG: hypothetical protein DI595_20765 [Agrobacterium fabrum]|uniref:Uncharacterized protein n=1 Tax=Agrobacterium fabrum TaxID=1176649 RepID=A0A2W5EHR2_9HYPH|nr:MAG: hypothetical protein DI595_20765 [Agrobacterium fabrum]